MRRRTSLVITLAVGSVLLLGAVAAIIWGGCLPPTVDPGRLWGDSTRPSMVAHPAVLGTQTLGILMYGCAAIAFARQGRGPVTSSSAGWVPAACSPRSRGAGAASARRASSIARPAALAKGED